MWILCYICVSSLAMCVFWKLLFSTMVCIVFFLWGYLKSQVFKAPVPHTVQELKHRIQQEVKRIPMEMLQRVMGDVGKILTECLERNGGHLNDVIFGKYDFCFQCVKLNLNSFIYTLCSHVLKLNK